MKVALYARVSRPDEEPHNQLLRLRQYALDKGYVVHAEYVDIASGAVANRPALDRLMADARGNRFSLVLCVKVDRFGRSVLNLYNTLEQLNKEGVAFECTDQSFSTQDASGRLLLGVLACVAEFERELIRERTIAGLVRARARGVKLGRPRKNPLAKQTPVSSTKPIPVDLPKNTDDLRGGR